MLSTATAHNALTIYVLRKKSNLSSHGLQFVRRNDALKALMHMVVSVGSWKSGFRNASVFEYTESSESDLPLASNRRKLRRRWFLRNFGDVLPPMHTIIERVARPEDNVRFVLHMYDYQNHLLMPVHVRNVPLLRENDWLLDYRLAHWLTNASRSQLRAAARLLKVRVPRRYLLVAVANDLRAKLFRHARGCTDAFRRMLMPSHKLVFDFEQRNLHNRVCEPNIYIFA